MQTIEINTAQNVKIEYQLAGLAHRAFAYLIDLATLLVLWIIYFNTFEPDLSLGLNYSTIIVLLLFVFYSLISELLANGQSLGKFAMGIKVIKMNGDELEFYDYFSRWALRFIDIYFSFGTIAAILIVSNKNGQRLGDLIGGTTVINKRSSFGFQLSDILRLNQKDRENYNFQYPLSHRLEEKDVLLIKSLLYRKQKYNNLAHQEALDMMVKKVAKLVDADSIPNDKQAFLNKIMTEYIILTR
ncbi:MAG: RDD family protein [Bacteroidetes bacterium]|nr:RDD family protein [Bacteroidota bacterium]